MKLEQIGKLNWNEIRNIMSYFYKTSEFMANVNEILIQEIKVERIKNFILKILSNFSLFFR